MRSLTVRNTCVPRTPSRSLPPATEPRVTSCLIRDGTNSSPNAFILPSRVMCGRPDPAAPYILRPNRRLDSVGERKYILFVFRIF